MPSQQNAKWPTLSISEEDNTRVKELQKLPGVFRNVESRDVLMTAAAIATKMRLPASVQAKNSGTDIIHTAILNSEPLTQYRQFMILIYYITQSDGTDLANMSDIKAIVDNFKDYAHRGLLYLSEKCKELNGNSELLAQYGEALANLKSELRADTKI